MNNGPEKPSHINATSDDLAGNHGIGRYIFLPGSDGRAKQIANHFEHVTVKSHPRGHNLYLGTLNGIDVATVSSGMGCPSMEIILHELYHLGAKRFLRVGTAGSLQPNHVKSGDIVNAIASVRDESTTSAYVPIEVPALASLEYTSAIIQAAKNLSLTQVLHTGIVHCKDSLYGREFGFGPRAEKHHEYLRILSEYGVLATEMETAALFIQTQLYHHALMQQGTGPAYHVLSGAILNIIQLPESPEANHAIELAIETTHILFANETFQAGLV